MGNAKRQNLLTRCIKLMNVLAPHIVSGLSVTELSEKTGLPPQWSAGTWMNWPLRAGHKNWRPGAGP